VEPFRDPRLPAEFGPSSAKFFTEWTVRRNAEKKIAKIVRASGRKMLATDADATTATERKKIAKVILRMDRKQARVVKEMKQKEKARAARAKERLAAEKATRISG
jgi:hypothetical protein